MIKLFADARPNSRISDVKMLFYNFSVHVAELYDTFHLVRRAKCDTELCLEVRSTGIAFAYANVFRVYHRQIAGAEPVLFQTGSK